MTFGWCFSVCILFVLVGLRLEEANAQFLREVGTKKLAYWSIVVDQSGHGNFTTIQSAIDSVPSQNMYWVSIKVKAGIYREKVKIPYDKPYIILKGEGKRRTFVEWDDHHNTSQSPTFVAMADNLVVKSISFRNSYNNPTNRKLIKPAVAAMVSGDKSYFFRVGFFGLQDTLWDDTGRHYYKLCTIQGAIDFIFGAGQSLFERCSISVIGGALDAGLPGFITAQGRTNSEDGNGFVFNYCHVFGNGTTYLGRPWRSHARVLFYKTNFSNVVQPAGWDAWRYHPNEGNITFAEYGNFGPGSDTSQRVSWMKKLDLETIESMTSTKFIDTDGWLQKQPF
ncbi:probable pectinesterase 29 [Vigna unguiculata]|uniref:probable pectinesterase 29 n=1 Tax=Vigna unguiculata TaxID=3917 RepID=UPI001016A6F6|nr:probable pectinesterase 29 [Vigna unguiculata]